MKKGILVAIFLLVAQQSLAQNALLFCQNMSLTNGYVTYLDIYAEYEQHSDTYRKMEIDVYSYEDNFVFPNVFWKVKSQHQPEQNLVQISAEKDWDNHLKFQLPGTARGLKLSSTDGVLDRFSFTAKGAVYGRTFNGEFSCYDASLFIPTPID